MSEPRALPRSSAFLGVFFALNSLMFALFWMFHPDFRLLLADPQPVCWPGFRVFCKLGLLQAAVASDLFLGSLGAASILAALLWWRHPGGGRAWAFLGLVAVLRVFFILTDARLGANFHTMIGWLFLGFCLLASQPRALVPLIAAFYFCAGLLKLNIEWLSGAALLRPLPFPAEWTEPLQWSVLALELIAIGGLFWRRTFWPVLAWLALFHSVSVFVVGWPYPLTMAGVLVFLILVHREGGSSWWPRPGRTRSFILLSAFLAAQFFPLRPWSKLTFTGEGRWGALSMLIAGPLCEAPAWVRRDGGLVELNLVSLKDEPQKRCQPDTILSRLRDLCDEGSVVRFAYWMKRKTDENWLERVWSGSPCDALTAESAWGLSTEAHLLGRSAFGEEGPAAGEARWEGDTLVAADGLWSYRPPTSSIGAGRFVHEAGSLWFFLTADGALRAIDEKSGALLWWRHVGRSADRMILKGNKLRVTFLDGTQAQELDVRTGF